MIPALSAAIPELTVQLTQAHFGLRRLHPSGAFGPPSCARSLRPANGGERPVRKRPSTARRCRSSLHVHRTHPHDALCRRAGGRLPDIEGAEYAAWIDQLLGHMHAIGRRVPHRQPRARPAPDARGRGRPSGNACPEAPAETRPEAPEAKARSESQKRKPEAKARSESQKRKPEAKARRWRAEVPAAAAGQR